MVSSLLLLRLGNPLPNLQTPWTSRTAQREVRQVRRSSVIAEVTMAFAKMTTTTSPLSIARVVAHGSTNDVLAWQSAKDVASMNARLASKRRAFELTLAPLSLFAPTRSYFNGRTKSSNMCASILLSIERYFSPECCSLQVRPGHLKVLVYEGVKNIDPRKTNVICRPSQLGTITDCHPF